jgi:hypothetical protein
VGSHKSIKAASGFWPEQFQGVSTLRRGTGGGAFALAEFGMPVDDWASVTEFRGKDQSVAIPGVSVACGPI